MVASVIRSRIVSAAALLEADRRAWSVLLEAQHPRGNAFLSPAFARSAARSGQGVRACLIEDEAGLAAVLAFQDVSGPGRLLGAVERVGEEMNDSFGLVARAGFTIAPRTLLRLADVNHLYFTHLPESQARFGLSGEKPASGLRIDLVDGADAYWSGLLASDRKFAADTDRRLRKAQGDLGPMRFELEAADPAVLLDELLAHKRAQYLRTGKGDWLASPERGGLLQDLARVREDDCRGCLSALYFGNTWAAMHFGLISRQTLHYWIPVYNPALNSYAPGRLLLREIIRNGPAAGITLIDRGIGESMAKQDFPSLRRTYLSGVWYRNTAAGWTYRLLQSAQWRLHRARKS